MLTSDEDWKKQEEAMKKSLKKAAVKSGSEILKKVSKKEEENKEVRMKCRMARRVFDEGIEMFESGDMSFENMVEDLYESLKAI